MAKDVSFIISANADRADKEIRRLQATGEDVCSILEREFSQLGTQSTLSIERQRAAIEESYRRIEQSGTASATEIARAYDQMRSKLAKLDLQINPQYQELQEAEAKIQELGVTGQQVTDRLGNDFQRLGVRTAAAIEQERKEVVAAFLNIQGSGVASAEEVSRAYATTQAKLLRLDREAAGLAGAKTGLGALGDCVDRVNNSFHNLLTGMVAFYVGGKAWEGFIYGIHAVDDFQQSVIKMSAMITSLQGGGDIAENYRRAKEYAAGLNGEMIKLEAGVSMPLASMQVIVEELTKQGILIDYNNAAQLKGFQNLSNAAAVYSRGGADERQLRSEIQGLILGEVSQQNQLASMVQRTVDGPLRQQTEQWKQSGQFLEQMGDKLKGFGPAADDIAKSWTGVKTSLETALSLAMRAGFTAIVQDLAQWLDRVNTYLKTHSDLIGSEIRSGWETIKTIVGGVATVLGFVKDNFEPFAAVIVGGTIVGGLVKIHEAWKDIKNVIIEARAAAIAFGLVSAAAPAAAAGAGAAATVTGGAAAAGGLGLLGSLGLGAGVLTAGGLLGYGLQPVVRWADKKLYENFGINFTGQAFYEEQEAKNQEADRRLQEMLAKRNGAAGGAAAPNLNLQDSEETIKRAIDTQNKALQAFKDEKDRETAISKEQAEIYLATLKGQYAAGLVTMRDYYDEEKRLSREAAQARVNNAMEYLQKEEQNLAYLESKKRQGSPEYVEEQARHQKALHELQAAQLDYAKSYIESENQETEALRRRRDEYDKLTAATLDDAEQYVEAERLKQEMDERSIDFLRLKEEALKGEKGAMEALAAVEKKRAVDLVTAQNKEHEMLRQYAEDLAKVADGYEQLAGKSDDLIKAGVDLRTGLQKEAQLRDTLALETAKGNAAAVQALTAQIQLQGILNSRLQDSLTLQEQVAVLQGKIVGFNNGTAITNSDAVGYVNGVPINPYVSPSSLLGSPSPTVNPYSASPFVDINGNPVKGSYASGTSYIYSDGYYRLHKGEEVRDRSAVSRAGSGGVVIHGGININLPNVTQPEQVDGRKLAREMYQELQRLQRKAA